VTPHPRPAAARPLTVGEPRENSMAVYYPVAPMDAPHAVVTVSWRAKSQTWLCHTCYTKPGTCAHIEATKQHLGERRAHQQDAA
jgi:hypothetical protein